MKFTANEEYGLRCLLRLGREAQDGSLTLPEISRAEGISMPYAAKIMRVLRQGGFVQSARGKAGGYSLSRPPERIYLGELLALLGGRLYDPTFCDRHSGVEEVCTNSVDCSVRDLWQSLQLAVDQVLSQMTLGDLLRHAQQLPPVESSLIQVTTVVGQSTNPSQQPSGLPRP
ncbi:MAG: RrF2 family transcriptional regulator [Terriglobia bacterium]